MSVPVTDPSWEFDHIDVGLAAHLHEVLADWRSRCPIARSERHGGYATALSYEAAQEAALDYTTYINSKGTAIPPLTGNLTLLPSQSDPPEHTMYRKLIRKYFTRQAVAVWEPRLREVTRARLTELAAANKADFVADVARHVPPIAVADIMGLRHEDMPRIFQWSNDLFVTIMRGDFAGNQRVVDEYSQYLRDEAARQREIGLDTLVTAIGAGEIDGRPLTTKEQLGMLLVLVSAGLETTMNGIGSMLYYIATVDGLRERLIADRTLIPKMVDECLRIQSPILGTGRTVTRDTTLAGQPLRAGERLLLAYGSANRDPAVFERPDEFVCPRDRNPHMAFGYGIHRCPGEHLALLEMRVVADEVLNLLPDYEILPGFEPEWVPGRLPRGMISLPVTF